MRGLSLGGDYLGVGMTGGSTISLKVTDDDGAVAQDNYGVSWHLPAEWQSSKQGPIQWEEVSPQSTPIGQTGWQGHLEGVWKYKAVQAGEVPGAQDAYEDAAVEAWDIINDVFGITDSANDGMDDAIKKVKEPRLRLLLGFAKAAGQAYGGQLYEEMGRPDQPWPADFDKLWIEFGNTDGNDSSWVNQNGESVTRPQINFDFMSHDRNFYGDGSTTDTPDQLEWDRQKAILEHCSAKDPKLFVEKSRRLFRGDGYNEHGYEGPVYKGVDTFTGGRRITATFVVTPPPSNP